MSLKQKIDTALEMCDGCCLDDSADRAVVSSCIIENLTCGCSQEFEDACAALRQILAGGAGGAARAKQHIETVLGALGYV